MTDKVPSTDIGKIREGLIDELKTINNYEEMASNTSDPDLKAQFEEIIDDEKVHVGNFAGMTSEKDPKAEPLMRKGLEEIKKAYPMLSIRDMMCGDSHFEKRSLFDEARARKTQNESTVKNPVTPNQHDAATAEAIKNLNMGDWKYRFHYPGRRVQNLENDGRRLIRRQNLKPTDYPRSRANDLIELMSGKAIIARPEDFKELTGVPQLPEGWSVYKGPKDNRAPIILNQNGRQMIWRGGELVELTPTGVELLKNSKSADFDHFSTPYVPADFEWDDENIEDSFNQAHEYANEPRAKDLPNMRELTDDEVAKYMDAYRNLIKIREDEPQENTYGYSYFYDTPKSLPSYLEKKFNYSPSPYKKFRKVQRDLAQKLSDVPTIDKPEKKINDYKRHVERFADYLAGSIRASGNGDPPYSISDIWDLLLEDEKLDYNNMQSRGKDYTLEMISRDSILVNTLMVDGVLLALEKLFDTPNLDLDSLTDYATNFANAVYEVTTGENGGVGEINPIPSKRPYVQNDFTWSGPESYDQIGQIPDGATGSRPLNDEEYKAYKAEKNNRELQKAQALKEANDIENKKQLIRNLSDSGFFGKDWMAPQRSKFENNEDFYAAEDEYWKKWMDKEGKYDWNLGKSASGGTIDWDNIYKRDMRDKVLTRDEQKAIDRDDLKGDDYRYRNLTDAANFLKRGFQKDVNDLLEGASPEKTEGLRNVLLTLLENVPDTAPNYRNKTMESIKTYLRDADSKNIRTALKIASEALANYLDDDSTMKLFRDSIDSNNEGDNGQMTSLPDNLFKSYRGADEILKDLTYGGTYDNMSGERRGFWSLNRNAWKDPNLLDYWSDKEAFKQYRKEKIPQRLIDEENKRRERDKILRKIELETPELDEFGNEKGKFASKETPLWKIMELEQKRSRNRYLDALMNEMELTGKTNRILNDPLGHLQYRIKSGELSEPKPPTLLEMLNHEDAEIRESLGREYLDDLWREELDQTFRNVNNFTPDELKDYVKSEFHKEPLYTYTPVTGFSFYHKTDDSTKKKRRMTGEEKKEEEERKKNAKENNFIRNIDYKGNELEIEPNMGTPMKVPAGAGILQEYVDELMKKWMNSYYLPKLTSEINNRTYKWAKEQIKDFDLGTGSPDERSKRMKELFKNKYGIDYTTALANKKDEISKNELKDWISSLLTETRKDIHDKLVSKRSPETLRNKYSKWVEDRYNEIAPGFDNLYNEYIKSKGSWEDPKRGYQGAYSKNKKEVDDYIAKQLRERGIESTFDPASNKWVYSEIGSSQDNETPSDTAVPEQEDPSNDETKINKSLSFEEMLKSANKKQWEERGLPSGSMKTTLPAYYRTVSMGCEKDAINVYEHQKMPIGGDGISVKKVPGIGPKMSTKETKDMSNEIPSFESVFMKKSERYVPDKDVIERLATLSPEMQRKILDQVDGLDPSAPWDVKSKFSMGGDNGWESEEKEVVVPEKYMPGDDGWTYGSWKPIEKSFRESVARKCFEKSGMIPDVEFMDAYQFQKSPKAYGGH